MPTTQKYSVKSYSIIKDTKCPFGMLVRSYSDSIYRFGFNGKERDDEIAGLGNSLNFGARIYDSRLGRWLSLDPLDDKFPQISPYSSFNDNPLFFIDIEGKQNTLYLILIPDENGETVISKRTARKIARLAEKRFKAMGINVNVKVAPVGDLRPDLIDNSDSFVLLGKNAETIENFISKADDNVILGLDYVNLKAAGGTEVSSNISDGYSKGNLITVFWEEIESDINTANSELAKTPKLKFVDGKPNGTYKGLKAVQLNNGSKQFTKASYAAFVIVHGSGHNAGIGHTNANVNHSNYDPNEKGTLMSDGNFLFFWSKDAFKESKNVTNEQINKFKSKFNGKKPVDNLRKRMKNEKRNGVQES